MLTGGMGVGLLDKIPANTTSTRTMTISSAASGNDQLDEVVNSPVDADWIRITLRAGELYKFTANNNNSTLDPFLWVRDSSGFGLAVDDNSGPGNAALIKFRPTISGVYFLDVSSSGGASAGGYRLIAREVPANIQTHSIGIGSGVLGDIHSTQDQDWHAVTMSAGQNVIFDVIAGTLGDPTLSLRDPAGGVLTFNNNGGLGLNARIEFTALTAGTYFLDVGGFGSSTGTYTLAARTDDAADDIKTTDSLAVGASQAGIINTALDRDFFAITLTAGTSYIFDAVGVSVNPTLYLRNAIGVPLDFDDNGGLGTDARIEFTAGASGTYFLDVGQTGLGPGNGNYILSARVDDIADDTKTTANLTLWTSSSGTINDAGDQDFFRVSLAAGVDYIFEVAVGSVIDSTLALRDVAGTQLAFNDDAGGVLGFASRIKFTPSFSGTYYLDVGGFGSNTGSYAVSARVDDVADDTATTDFVQVSSTTTGEINALGDDDWFGIVLTSGVSYFFAAIGNTLSDPDLTLWSAFNTPLAYNNDTPPASLDSGTFWTATYTGAHFLEVGAFGDGGIGTYTLFA